VPHFIHPLNAEMFAVAGLHEWGPGKDGAAPVETFTIITTGANEMMAKLHDRMPVILEERDREVWLDPKNENTEELQKLLVPCSSEEIRAYPVSARVNNTSNEGVELIEPLSSINPIDETQPRRLDEALRRLRPRRSRCGVSQTAS
jgi:putative SOS response-associated peptidase YedK